MQMYYESDCDLEVLRAKRIAVIGYGSQGRAQALNLRDGGFDVEVGVRTGGPSASLARGDGFEICSVEEAVRRAEVVMLLIPDEHQPIVYREQIAPNLSSGACLGFAHGYCIHYGLIHPEPTINVFLAAPKGIGAMVRRRFEAGEGVPCLMAVHQNPAGNTREVAMAYATAVCRGRMGILETTFREETETDLFGEQAVLCGGLTELIRGGFETLTEAGYPPELAYFECVQEVKLIADLIYERGISGMREFISPTALFGDMTRGRRVIDESSRSAMKQILEEIRSGVFVREQQEEIRSGNRRLDQWVQQQSNHPMEEVGRRLRKTGG